MPPKPSTASTSVAGTRTAPAHGATTVPALPTFSWSAVAQAAGLYVSRVDGSAIRYNNADTYLPDLLICRAELAGEVLRLAAEYSSY